MRHRVYGKKLGRNKNERTRLFKGLVQELFLHGSLTTSETKAKSIKGLVDKIINLAKNKNSQRLLQSYFTNKVLEERVAKEIAPKLQDRVSGYTSIVRLGLQEGDRTTYVKMSLIGQEELKPLAKESSKEKKVVSVPPTGSPRFGEAGEAGKRLESNDKRQVASGKSQESVEEVKTKKSKVKKEKEGSSL